MADLETRLDRALRQPAFKHKNSGNCFGDDRNGESFVFKCKECGDGNLCDVCHVHCMTRGECDECPRCHECDKK